MPMNEYRCSDCGHRFTQLEPYGTNDTACKCPKCGGKETKKVFSSFSIRNPGSDDCKPGGG